MQKHKGWLEFSKRDIKRFKRKYKKAMEAKEEAFVFNGKDFLTGYAKYVIEYLDSFN